MSNFALETQNIRKHYNGLLALKGISLEVKQGEFFGFLGPNGAGKSTFLKIITTITVPDSGDVWIASKNIKKNVDEIRKNIGVVFQETTLDLRLTGKENLLFHGWLYNMPDNLIQERSEKLFKRMGLWERRNDITKSYSGGMRRKLELIRAFLHEPRIIFLDEPTLGLDPKSRIHILEYLSEIKTNSKTTIFMTTHYLDEAEICDRIAIIDRGKIIAQGTPREIEGQGNATNLNEAFLNLTGRDIEEEKTFENTIQAQHRER